MAQAGETKVRGGFRRRVSKFFMVVGVLATLFTIVGVVTLVVILSRKEPVPASTILELRLDRPIKEAPNSSGLGSLLAPSTTTLPSIVKALDEGSRDGKVAGLVVWVGGEHGLATLQELRQAITRFRKAGKFAIAFSPSFGEMTGGTGAYYLATACDEVWLQPSGMLGITGLRAEVPFVAGMLENVGVHAEGGKRKAYKNAFNTFTERSFTKAHEEATQALLGEILDQLVADIAADRKLDEQTVRKLFAEGPFLADAALAAKLIDHVGYRDQVVAAAKGKSGGTGTLLYTGSYLERAGKDDLDEGQGAKLAVIYGVGSIMPGRGSLDPLSGEASMGADTIAAALRAAARDEDVKAVIFRIDSPGGSYVASDTIWRETLELEQAGKPLIVSMANVAASGGYFVAMNARKIVAEPATLTGSIGVYAMKFVTKDLWAKVGLSWGTLATSANANMWSTLSSFNEEERQKVDAWLDFVYADFTSKVAAARKLQPEAVEEAAQGRVWSGRRAKELGLVDELGGMQTAVVLAKQAAGLAADAPVRLVAFPEHQGLLSLIFDRDRDSSDDDAATTVWRSTLLERAEALSGGIRDLEGAVHGAGDVRAAPLKLR